MIQTFFEWLAMVIGVPITEVKILTGAVIGLCSLTGFVAGKLGIAYGKAKGWNDRRHHIDRDNVAIDNIAFRDLPDGTVELRVFTPPTLPTLHEVFADIELESAVRRGIAECKPGDALMPLGPLHHRAMSRVDRRITGDIPQAIEDAVDERDDRFENRERAFILTSSFGDDGMEMPRVIKIKPSRLLMMGDQEFVDRLIPHRETHRPFIEMLQRMAINYVLSQKLFAGIEPKDEIEAGSHAPVWTTDVQTEKNSFALGGSALKAA